MIEGRVAKVATGKGAPGSLPKVAVHAPGAPVVAGRYRDHFRVAGVSVVVD
jgi:hypothetical protein